MSISSDKHPYRWLKHALPVMVLATAIRLIGFADAQLMHDELSAWSRLHFNSFSDLLQYGVMVDTHPALTQVFLWAWTGLFGDATWVMKIPFVLMSLGTILILYKLAYEAFGRNSADLTGVIIATAQMFPVFSLQARPYTLGLLVCSALAWTWYLIAFRKSRDIRTYLWFGILLALAVYTHYFSGLLAVVIWTCGWLFHPNLNKKWYWISAAIGTALFLPHLPITIQQMGYKGIGGWLNAPDSSFFFEWLQGLFNYHTPTLLIFGSLLLLGAIRRMKEGNSNFWILPGVFGGWFLVVFTVGFAYSHFVDPLLHHGSLYFAAPFLSMALSAIACPPKAAGKIVNLTIAVLLIVSLIWTRSHYTILKTQPFATIMQELKRLDKLSENTVAIVSQNEEYLRYYGDTGDFAGLHINRARDDRSEGQLTALIAEKNPEYVFLDGKSPAITLGTSLMYSHVEEIQGFTFTGLIYSNRQTAESMHELVYSRDDTLETRDEFIPIFTSNLGMEGFSFADEVGGLVHFAERPAENVILVADFWEGEETVRWTGGSLEENAFEYSGETILPHQVLLWNIFTRYHDMQGVRANVYLWNPKKTTIKINRRQAFKMRGNPNRYGLLSRRP